MNPLDELADKLRLKDAQQRETSVIDWRWLTDTERSKWRDLALVAVVHLSKPPTGTAA